MRVFTLTVAALALTAPLLAQSTTAPAPATTATTESQPAPAPAKPVLISGGVMGKQLIHAVPPDTPLMARQNHISGSVVCLVDISPAGVPTRVEPKSGADVLRQAAVDAIKKFRYKPYLLNGRAVAVETTVVVNFAP